MDFASIFADSSVIATAIFGIVALLVEHKNRRTGKISGIGRILLGGIVLSAFLNVAVNFSQRQEAKVNEALQRQEIQRLTQSTQIANRQLSRITTGLEDGTLFLRLRLPCNVREFRQACIDKRRYYTTIRRLSPNTNRYLPRDFNGTIEVMISVSDRAEGELRLLAMRGTTNPDSWDVSGHGDGPDGFEYLIAEVEVGPLRVAMANGIAPAISEIAGRTARLSLTGPYADSLVYVSVRSRGGAAVSSSRYNFESPRYLVGEIRLSRDFGSGPLVIRPPNQAPR